MYPNPLLRMLLSILAFGCLTYSAPNANSTEINSRHYGHYSSSESVSTKIHDHQYYELDKRAIPAFQMRPSPDGLSFTALLPEKPGGYGSRDAKAIAKAGFEQIDTDDKPQ